MESYKEFLKSEVQEFRKAGHRFLGRRSARQNLKVFPVGWVYMRSRIRSPL